MDVPIGRESSALRTTRLALERIAMRLEEIQDDASPHDLRDLASEANSALVRLQAEQEPLVRVIRPADVEKIEGDGRGALLFLKRDEEPGAIGPVWVIAPSVVELLHDVVQRYNHPAAQP